MLSDIQVLFRAPESLGLYGIRYRMRPGQSPGQIWKASGRSCPSDWVWLGSPGWYGHLSSDAQKEIAAFLSSVEDIPMNAYDWCEVSIPV